MFRDNYFDKSGLKKIFSSAYRDSAQEKMLRK